MSGELKIEGQEESRIEREHYVLIDQDHNGSDLVLEVNWNDSVKPFKKIRLTDDKSGKKYVIDKGQLMSILFMVSDEDDQQRFISEKMTNKVVFERYYDVKMTKDYRKGEIMTVRLPMSAQLEEFKRRPMRFDPREKDKIVVKK